MKCIYFDNTCSGDRHIPYDPSEEDKKKYCESYDFRTCPRFQAFQKNR